MSPLNLFAGFRCALAFGPLLLLVLLSLTLGAGARAGVVNSTADDGSVGTLRSQIASTSAGGTITFAAGVTGTIMLGSELDISQSVTITGPGAGVIAVSGNNAVRVFGITGGNSVHLRADHPERQRHQRRRRLQWQHGDAN